MQVPSTPATEQVGAGAPLLLDGLPLEDELEELPPDDELDELLLDASWTSCCWTTSCRSC